MKIRCIANTGKDLSKLTIESGQLVTTIYPLDIGKSYSVYGIDVWRGCIDYLIDIGDHPGWYPAELFEVVDSVVPSEWHFSFNGYNQDYPLYGVFGYKEMVFDSKKHNSDLLDWEPAARALFFKRKREIDELEERKMLLVGKKGKIIEGVNKGWEVLVKDNSEDSGGFLVFVSKGNDGYVEDWVQDKEELRELFLRKEWKIAWEE